MRTLGNVLWFLFGGLPGGIAWLLAGVIWCITIVGFPIGVQCFKFMSLAFFPFRKDVVYSTHTVSVIINVLWLLISGVWLAIFFLIAGGVLCVTVVGIPFGMQFFKMAKLALMPFGADVVPLYP